MFKSRLKSSLILAGILLAAPLCARAYNPFQSVRDYNAVIFGNATATNGDIEGRAAIASNFSASSFGVGNEATSEKTKYSLVVGGDLSTQDCQIYNGNTAYGGQLLGKPSTNGDYTITNAKPVDFQAIKTEMQSLSTYLATLSSTGTVYFDGYSSIYLDGTDPTLNVFNIGADQLVNWYGVTNRQITAPTGSTVIINVAGDGGSLANGMTLNGTSESKVIFNYYQASNLELKLALTGSLLAPDTDVTYRSGSVNGIGVVNNSTQVWGGEYHNKGFDGDVPNAPAVPEPGTVVAACAILSPAAFVFRRKRV